MPLSTQRYMEAFGPLLVVDDNDDDLNLTTTILQKVGGVAHLLTFPGGEEVIAYLARGPHEPLPLGVVLDVKMPRQNGLDTLAWIRVRRQFDRLPIAMWSSSDDPRDVTRAAELGAQCYFGKYPPVPVVQGMLADMAAFHGNPAAPRVFPVRGNLLLGRSALPDLRTPSAV